MKFLTNKILIWEIFNICFNITKSFSCIKMIKSKVMLLQLILLKFLKKFLLLMQISFKRLFWNFLNLLLLLENPNLTSTSFSISLETLKEDLKSKSYFLKNVKSISTIQNLEMPKKNNLLNLKISLIKLADQNQSKNKKNKAKMTKLKLLEKRKTLLML